jgi:hypothetical protein
MGSHEDWLRAAAFLFERHRRGRLEHALFDEWIAEAGLDGADVGLVEERIQALLDSGELDAGDRIGAYGALKYSGNRGHVGFLRRRLAQELDEMRVATQAMFALAALGEPVFGADRPGISHDEDEPNRRDAEEYLARLE